MKHPHLEDFSVWHLRARQAEESRAEKADGLLSPLEKPGGGWGPLQGMDGAGWGPHSHLRENLRKTVGMYGSKMSGKNGPRSRCVALSWLRNFSG